MKNTYLIRFIALVLMALVAVIPAQAQDEIILQRIDQAMVHLTGYVNAPSTITRQSHSWRWEEQVWEDAGLGCPIPGESYPAQPNRGPSIVITYNSVEYNYRASWDGSILVLCAADGQPLYRSDDPAFLPGQTPQAVSTNIPNFHAWIYMSTQQQFYLINSQLGELASVQRPMMAGENFDSLKSFAFSRDGRYLLQAVSLNNGTEAVTIFDMQTGSMVAIPGAGNEEASLGASDFYNGSFYTGGRLITNADNTQAIVSFTSIPDMAANTWRVLVVDLATGTTLHELTRAQLLPILSASPDFIAQINNQSAFSPYPVFLDDDGNVHFYLVLLFAGGATNYPALAWNPAANTVVQSPFGRTSAADILPDGRLLYADYLPEFPAAVADGPFQPSNVVISDRPLEPGNNQAFVIQGSTQVILNVRWAANGDQIIYSTLTDRNSMNPPYTVRNLAGGAEYILTNLTVGAPGGVLTTLDSAAGPTINYYDSPAGGQAIWTAPPRNGNPVFAWVQFTDVPLGLTALFDGQSITTGSGIVVSPSTGSDCGTLPSAVRVGVVARSTIIDGSPLNVRSAPSTSAQVARIIPEDTRFTIIGGPVCANGYTWWAVQLEDGLDGWVAESGAEFYFIEIAP